jgi:predicted Zn-dependent protease
MKSSFLSALAGIALLATLSACAGAQYNAPILTPQEIAQEQQEQEAYVRNRQRNGSRAITASELHSRLVRVGSRVQRGGLEVCLSLRGEGANCTYEIVAIQGNELNAAADGKRILITPAMVAFAASDDALGFILSHEYAHNVLEHVQSTQQNAGIGGLLGTVADAILAQQGVNTGSQFAKAGQQMAVMRYSRAFEAEADYVGLYIAARAGLDITQAPGFWREMAGEHPNSIYVSTTHPTTAERYVAMRKTIAEIQQKQAAGQPLLPNPLPKR